MSMHKHRRGVACVWHCPYPAVGLNFYHLLLVLLQSERDFHTPCLMTISLVLSVSMHTKRVATYIKK